MNSTRWPNVVAMFFDQMGQRPDAPLLWEKKDGAFFSLNRREVAVRVASLAKGLTKLGVQPGDRLVLVSENRPQWLIADMAIMTAGAFTTPAYITNTSENHLHILTNSGAKGAVVSGEKLLKKFLPAALQAPNLDFIIVMDRFSQEAEGGVKIHRWDEVCQPSPDDLAWAQKQAESFKREDIACIIHTSGTGGEPKGVMTTHGAILHNCAGGAEVLSELGLGDDRFLSFLPLSHTYEHTAGQCLPLFLGAEIYYCAGADQVGADMVLARPTLMTAVPRFYETLHSRLVRGVKRAGGLKQFLFETTLALGEKRRANEHFSLTDKVMDFIVDRLVRDKLRKSFGGRLKVMVSGGAPLDAQIIAFFDALGLRILQGYGLTESGPVASVNRPSKIKFPSVGQALTNTEVRLADDGELLIRGELVMRGYWQDEAATQQAIRDGWLHTGDIAEIDEDGFITITDRKKDLIVNSGGDNISPTRVEGYLVRAPELAQAMVYGDRHPHLVAVLTPDPDWLQGWATSLGKPKKLSQLTKDADLLKAVSEAVNRVNSQLSTIEKIRKFIIADEPFSVENGQLTPTLKIRRHKIRKLYAARLERLFQAG